MQTTFILRNLTEPTIQALADMAPKDALQKLTKWAFGDLRHCVTVKYGSGAFRDRVEWNAIIRAQKPLSFKIEPRRGYKLITFTEGLKP
jgi:hypothetical protein